MKNQYTCPGFIYNPRNITNGIRTKEIVLNIDIAPTILEFAGIEIPEDMDGKSLLSLLKHHDKPFREDFLYEHHYRHLKDLEHIERSEGIRNREWSYIHYIDQQGPISEELYNIRQDPLEMNDLSGNPDFTSLLDSLRAQQIGFPESK